MVGHVGSPEANRALVADCVNAIWCNGDTSQIGTYYASDHELHDESVAWTSQSLHAGSGDYAIRRLIEHYRATFKGFSFRSQEQIAASDKVVTRFTISGVHAAQLADVPDPGGTRMEGVCIDRVVDGRIRETWIYSDFQRLQQPLLQCLNKDSIVTTLLESNVEKMHHQLEMASKYAEWSFVFVGAFLAVALASEEFTEPRALWDGFFWSYLAVLAITVIMLIRSLDWRLYGYMFSQREMLCSRYLRGDVRAIVNFYRWYEEAGEDRSRIAVQDRFGVQWGLPRKRDLLGDFVRHRRNILNSDFVGIYLIAILLLCFLVQYAPLIWNVLPLRQ
jgi:predicted ester cyclase